MYLVFRTMKTHTIKLYKWSDDCKSVIEKIPYKITYVPTKKWNEYLILINDKFCGYIIKLNKIYCGKSISVRELIGKSIVNYLKDITFPFQNRTKIFYPSDDIFNFTKKVFDIKLLNMGDFKSKDELTKLNLI